MSGDARDTGGGLSALRSSRSIRRMVMLAAVALGVLSIVARISFIASPRGAATDFSQDYLSAKAWSDGLDPYTDTGQLVDKYFGSRSGYYDLLPPSQRNPHPPAYIALNRPLSGLPFRTARIMWLLLSAALTAVAMGWFVRQLGSSRSVSIVTGIGSLAIPVVQTDLVYGQSNGILLLLLVAGWFFLRRGNQAGGGVALGIAAALKLFPVFMIIPLLVKRQIRAAVWLVSAAASVTILGAAIFGLHATREFITSVSPQNLRYWRSAPMNLSALSIPFRWLTHSPWRTGTPNQPTIAGIVAIAILVVCVAGAVRATRVAADGFWTVVPWMLLATPIVWETYLVLVLPLVWLVVKERIAGAEQRATILVLLGVAAVVVGLVPGLPPTMRTGGAAQLFGYALPTYGLMVLAAGSILGWIATRPVVQPEPLSA